MPMLIIAVTGGIGAGKSTAVDMFRKYNVPVIDTDIIARKLVDNDPSILQAMTKAFGEIILDEKKNLDRAQLRKIIFNDEQKRKALQDILHPRIHQQVLSDLESLQANYCIIVIPLLVESVQDYPFDRVLLVDADEQVQIDRAAQRDNNSAALIQKIMSAQASREERRAAADDIIDNNGPLSDLQEQVADLHSKYLKLSQS